ncbi:MAG: hypothetical protein QOI30_3277, partial [Mycobacterium sp.]|nr:hypothetical protein [Mycobacterium sp.]
HAFRIFDGLGENDIAFWHNCVKLLTGVRF